MDGYVQGEPGSEIPQIIIMYKKMDISSITLVAMSSVLVCGSSAVLAVLHCKRLCCFKKAEKKEVVDWVITVPETGQPRIVTRE